MPKAREVRRRGLGGGKQGAANWVKKVQAPPRQQGAGEERSLLAGPQIASGAEMKCWREAQVRAGVSDRPRRWAFH